MSLQGINSNLSLLSDKWCQNRSKGEKNLLNSADYALQKNLSATISNSYYKSSSLSVEYTSSDGDKVSFSYESIEYGKSVMQLQVETDPEKIKELAKTIKDEFLAMKKELLKSLFGDKSVEGIDKTKELKKLEIPEYWNAENTSQRIVDFAVSFYGIVDTKNEEYFNQIKAAIEDGFKQAKEILGELPNEIESLVNDTYNLSMQKLDSWAQEKGITTETTVV